ncbi:hypothetical protein MYCTH_2114944 [Thermothelomyces thermophilus ATCC 42464]|uniref:DnaJ-like protein C11 C-terminal domain-containing protein n=1 Tax=Thermothelomyces thermophilus (strain ATCC 42464 / BCRC 31852 / DSM 1799) TaxID=573729 RepID=G2Q0Y5_THET4|nr:uncharacterized protein MYCTH_2114944 [Thermothelomyces thermophilus ATCC 42464]AEO54083.1 hypothetical protein MYCTH_2114944 [Thermothelomyces thermophilus ATCC 42464]
MDLASRRIPPAGLDDGTSIRSRAYYNSSHLLRHAESRYSLQEQFAVTKKEYEFGFDDASSVLERSTLASGAVRANELDDDDDGKQTPVWVLSSVANRTYYELLCLPKGVSLSPDQVCDAAYRLLEVLAVDKQPPRLRSSAAFYLGLTQAACETLVEPSRRLAYDLYLSEAHEPASDSPEPLIDDDLPGPGSCESYENQIQEQYLLLTQRESRANTDLCFRVGAAAAAAPLLTSQRGSRQHGLELRVLDFSLRKTATTGVPALRQSVERMVVFLQGLPNKGAPKVEGSPFVRVADPTVTITGATHGLLDERIRLAPSLSDRYQLPGPSIHGRRRAEQLLASQFLPLLSLNLRQALSWRGDPTLVAGPDLVVEHELELLPHLSTTTRVGYSVNLSGADEPLNIEVSARKPLTRSPGLHSTLGFAVHERVGSGTAFLIADGGDWNPSISKECQELSRCSKTVGGLAPMVEAFRNSPTVEIGYAFGRHDLGMQSGQALTKPSERGLSTLDSDLDERKPSSWTASVGFTPGNAAAYLRYGRDLFASRAQTRSSPKSRTGLRAEVELASTVQHDFFFLAFRALKRIGRFSKAGLEIGFSPSNLHLSFYWSRLGQRISLPFLVANSTTARSRFATRLLFWTTIFPFAAFAAWECYRRRRWCARKASSTSTTAEPERGGAKTVQLHIARRRAEADELTVVLATGVEPRQAAQRQRGGLVIAGAKYGVRDAPPEESRLLGFWDPAPLSGPGDKVLRVRYLWRGKERTVEVGELEELRLP